MGVPKKVPTGQELDQQHDELLQQHDAEAFPTPEEQRQEKEELLEDYAEDMIDPD
jgi:hypothetical protein